MMIAMKDVSFGYTETDVLKEINFGVKRGDFTVITGDNGSGKSTLIKCMLGELRPRVGQVELMGKNIQDYRSFRAIGYVPQTNIIQRIAFPVTVSEMIGLSLYESLGWFKIPNRSSQKLVAEIAEHVGIEEYLDRPVRELSGGLQQRTLIAKALINAPDVLILDEPTVGVDVASRHDFFRLIDRLNLEEGLTVVLVTHQVDEVLEHVKQVTDVYEVREGKCHDVSF